VWRSTIFLRRKVAEFPWNQAGGADATSKKDSKKTPVEWVGLRKLILRRGERLPTSPVGVDSKLPQNAH
jgi:hypothetical protein